MDISSNEIWHTPKYFEFYFAGDPSVTFISEFDVVMGIPTFHVVVSSNNNYLLCTLIS